MRHQLRGPLQLEDVGPGHQFGVDGDFLNFRSTNVALTYLRARAMDPDNLRVLRGLVCETPEAFHSRTDEQVIEMVAFGLVAGSFRVSLGQESLSNTRWLALGSVTPGKPKSAPAPASSAPKPPPAAAPARPAPPAPPADRAVEIQQNRQAAVLAQAAEQGAPFCEECEKARRKRNAA